LILAAIGASVLQLATSIVCVAVAASLADVWQKDSDITRYVETSNPTTRVGMLLDELEQNQYALNARHLRMKKPGLAGLKAVLFLRRCAVILVVISTLGAIISVSMLLILRVLPTRWRLPALTLPNAVEVAGRCDASIQDARDSGGTDNNSGPLARLYGKEQPQWWAAAWPFGTQASSSMTKNTGGPPAKQRVTPVPSKEKRTLSYDRALEYWVKNGGLYGARIGLLAFWQLPQFLVQLVRLALFMTHDRLKSCTG
jgi:hypothetical protein